MIAEIACPPVWATAPAVWRRVRNGTAVCAGVALAAALAFLDANCRCGIAARFAEFAGCARRAKRPVHARVHAALGGVWATFFQITPRLAVVVCICAAAVVDAAKSPGIFARALDWLCAGWPFETWRARATADCVRGLVEDASAIFARPAAFQDAAAAVGSFKPFGAATAAVAGHPVGRPAVLTFVAAWADLTWERLCAIIPSKSAPGAIAEARVLFVDVRQRAVPAHDVAAVGIRRFAYRVWTAEDPAVVASNAGDVLYPAVLVAHRGIDARVICISAANPPRHHSDLRVGAVSLLLDHWATRIALATVDAAAFDAGAKHILGDGSTVVCVAVVGGYQLHSRLKHGVGQTAACGRRAKPHDGRIDFAAFERKRVLLQSDWLDRCDWVRKLNQCRVVGACRRVVRRVDEDIFGAKLNHRRVRIVALQAAKVSGCTRRAHTDDAVRCCQDKGLGDQRPAAHVSVNQQVGHPRVIGSIVNLLAANNSIAVLGRSTAFAGQKERRARRVARCSQDPAVVCIGTSKLNGALRQVVVPLSLCDGAKVILAFASDRRLAVSAFVPHLARACTRAIVAVRVRAAAVLARLGRDALLARRAFVPSPVAVARAIAVGAERLPAILAKVKAVKRVRL